MTENVDEGDIAADYLEALLDIADMDGDIEIEADSRRTTLVVGEAGDDSLTPLSDPETVSALQELTRLAVQAKTGEFSRVVLDVAGSRDARTKELESMVARALSDIEGGAEQVALTPMSSYERKLVHDLVADAGLVSESEGEGRERHAVVKPAEG